MKYKEHFLIHKLKINELKKFKDSRRVKIFSETTLSTEQKNMIDSLYKNKYGKKIPYTWHRHYTAYTGNFDVNYFPELLYIPEFEYYMNLNRCFAEFLGDKNLLPYIANAANIKMPKTRFACIDGIIKDSLYNILTKEDFLKNISNIGECFYKITKNSSSGRSCKLLNIHEGIDQKKQTPITEIFETKNRNWVIQERLICHESIRRLYSKSVNTFRIITYRWKDEFYHMPAIMRIGRGGANVDNAHAGGIFIAISDDGLLHKTAFTEFRDKFTQHPDTGVVFEGYKIFNFPKVLDSAIKCHSMLPQFGCVNWDFTINNEGQPILIEANVKAGSIWLIEMAHGKGAFGEKTADVLKWLNKISHAKFADRKNYMFGNIPD